MKWPFGRRPMDAMSVLGGAEWVCRTCNEPHRGMFDLACDSPDQWSGGNDYEPNSVLDMTRDFLSADFCVLDGEHFMVRCVLEIPVHGCDQPFAFGCWGSLKRENFEAYVAHFDDNTVPPSAPWWSWLCNQLKPFADGNSVACVMEPRPGGQRPVLWVDDASHPLARAQEEGLSPEELLAVYAAHGHAP